MSEARTQTDKVDTTSSSTWAPLRRPVYRALWLAQLTSNVGTWMQNVGAAWLMGDLHGSTTQVALVQTATSLPVFLVGIVAGALADIVDRRRLLLTTQSWMLLTAGMLALCTALDAVNPLGLLLFTFALGLGAALNLPAWQAIQPELVPKEELGRAVSLASISMNLGRVLGPVLGGVVIALSGPEAVFALNALSFIAVLSTLAFWRPISTPSNAPPERLFGALRAGLRYARHAPRLRAVLMRAGLFVIPASSLMALLPVVSRGPLGLGATGFGVLFACFGIGAIGSAAGLARVAHVNTDKLMGFATVGVAACLAGMGLFDSPYAVGPLLVLGGACWTAAVSTFNVSTQRVLPAWVRARGLGLYILTVQGSLAIGSALWGGIAERAIHVSLLISSGALLASLAASLRWRINRREHVDLSSSAYWPEPVIVNDIDPDHGPVLVTVEYHVVETAGDDFSEAMRKVQRLRRRTGARQWGLYRDSSDPAIFVETFIVESWEEHMRQHQRTTAADQHTQAATLHMLVPGTTQVTRHLLWAYQ